MADPCPAGTFGSEKFLAYRISVTFASVLWVDFYGLKEVSNGAYFGFNVLVVIIGFFGAEILTQVLQTGPHTACQSTRPVLMPQFDSYAIAFYLALTVVNGLFYRPRYVFTYARTAFIVVTVILTPIGLLPQIPFTLGEMYASALLGAVFACGVFAYFSFVFSHLADVYQLEDDQRMLDRVGVNEFRSASAP